MNQNLIIFTKNFHIKMNFIKKNIIFKFYLTIAKADKDQMQDDIGI